MYRTDVAWGEADGAVLDICDGRGAAVAQVVGKLLEVHDAGLLAMPRAEQGAGATINRVAMRGREGTTRDWGAATSNPADADESSLASTSSLLARWPYSDTARSCIVSLSEDAISLVYGP